MSKPIDIYTCSNGHLAYVDSGREPPTACKRCSSTLMVHVEHHPYEHFEEEYEYDYKTKKYDKKHRVVLDGTPT